jgi:hypothetical protein
MIKRIFFVLVAAILFLSPLVAPSAMARATRTKASDIYVKGYYRKNGTYVKPYYKTPANKTKLDNYSCIDYGRC